MILSLFRKNNYEQSSLLINFLLITLLTVVKQEKHDPLVIIQLLAGIILQTVNSLSGSLWEYTKTTTLLYTNRLFKSENV